MPDFFLSPCPFCGATGPVIANDETKDQPRTAWFVLCVACDARGPEQWNGAWDGTPPRRTPAKCQAAAAERWNRRGGVDG